MIFQISTGIYEYIHKPSYNVRGYTRQKTVILALSSVGFEGSSEVFGNVIILI